MKRHLLSSTSHKGLATARSAPVEHVVVTGRRQIAYGKEIDQSDPLIMINDETLPWLKRAGMI